MGFVDEDPWLSLIIDCRDGPREQSRNVPLSDPVDMWLRRMCYRYTKNEQEPWTEHNMRKLDDIHDMTIHKQP